MSRDSRVVVDGSVEGSLNAHPSRYRRLRSVLRFNLLFVVGSAWGKASGESLTRQRCRVSNGSVFGYRVHPWRCLMGGSLLGL
jgi:hypothetical protein